MVSETLSRFAVGAFSFAHPLLVGHAVIWNYLHSKLSCLIGIDIVFDEYMWVEWESAFVIKG
ncbi:MAG: hypothetical protein BGP16_11780 [Sphingobium sp. 66-54]|nr:MAG: hypothetical protein BGP16_11780 [Sphingobium sp. 66-54]